MAKRTKTEVDQLFKSTFTEVKGTRNSGWDASDSEQLAIPLIEALTKSDGSAVKLKPEVLERIKAALQASPKRIVKYIKSHVEEAGMSMDECTEAHLLRIVDVTQFRTSLVKDGILKPSSKKAGKQSLSELLGG